MPQAIQIETQAEQQGSAHLHAQAVAQRENDRRLAARTPWMRQVFFPRLAGISLCAPSCRRM